MTDIYNTYDNIINYDSKRKKEELFITTYYNFDINNELVKIHKLFN
jgi:hypothetical protein